MRAVIPYVHVDVQIDSKANRWAVIAIPARVARKLAQAGLIAAPGAGNDTYVGVDAGWENFVAPDLLLKQPGAFVVKDGRLGARW